MKTKEQKCKEFTQEFGPPQRTRTVDIAQTISETYGYWYDGKNFIIIRRDQKGRYDPIDARIICGEEYCVLVGLATMAALRQL